MHRLFQGLSYVLNKNVATQSEAQRLHLRSPPRAARAIRPGPDGGLGLWGLWGVCLAHARVTGAFLSFRLAETALEA